MAPMVVRSSLEMMLDAIRQRDELPKDLPPALPVRPTSRGRLPTSRRLVPENLKFERSAPRRLEDIKEELTLRNDNDLFLKGATFYGTRMPELVSYEEILQVPEVSDFSAVLSPLAPVPVKKQGCDVTYSIIQDAASDDARNQTLQGILWVQKNFRCRQTHFHYQQLKAAAAILQSFVRGERTRHSLEVLIKRWRAAVVIQKHVRQWFTRAVFNEQQKDIIFLQSVIRGWLARKHLIALHQMKAPMLSPEKIIHANVEKGSATDPLMIIKDTYNEQNQVHPSVLKELRSQVKKTEAELREKEEENAILKLKIQEYEARWSTYELKMKSMEENWQKQLASLQMSFAAVRKSNVSEGMAKQSRQETSKVGDCYRSDEIISGYEALGGTPVKLQDASKSAAPGINNDGAHSSVSLLIDEFDQRRRQFDNDAGLLVKEMPEDLGPNINPYEELHKLKSQFVSWKKDYETRLKDTKTKLLKLGNPAGKLRKRWWCTVSTRRLRRCPPTDSS